MSQSAEQELIYPIEKSASGKNAYFHFCDIRGSKPSYAVCLHIIKAREEGRTQGEDFADCARACNRGECNAFKMRAEEIAAGRSLYYIERTNINPANTRSEKEAQEQALLVGEKGKYDANNPSYVRGWNSVKGTKTSDLPSPVPEAAYVPKPMKAAKPKPAAVASPSMADVLNVMIEDATKPKPAPAPTVIKPQPGETPMEFARRRAAILKAASK